MRSSSTWTGRSRARPLPVAHTAAFEGDTQFGGDVAFEPGARRFFSSFGTDTGWADRNRSPPARRAAPGRHRHRLLHQPQQCRRHRHASLSHRMGRCSPALITFSASSSAPRPMRRSISTVAPSDDTQNTARVAESGRSAFHRDDDSREDRRLSRRPDRRHARGRTLPARPARGRLHCTPGCRTGRPTTTRLSPTTAVRIIRPPRRPRPRRARRIVVISE